MPQSFGPPVLPGILQCFKVLTDLYFLVFCSTAWALKRLPVPPLPPPPRFVQCFIDHDVLMCPSVSCSVIPSLPRSSYNCLTVGHVGREVTPEEVLAWSEVRRGWIENGPTPNATMSPPKWFCIQMGRMPSTVCRFRAEQAHIYTAFVLHCKVPRVTYLGNCATPFRTCFIASMSDLVGVVGHGSLCAFLIVTSGWYMSPCWMKYLWTPKQVLFCTIVVNQIYACYYGLINCVLVLYWINQSVKWYMYGSNPYSKF